MAIAQPLPQDRSRVGRRRPTNLAFVSGFSERRANVLLDRIAADDGGGSSGNGRQANGDGRAGESRSTPPADAVPVPAIDA